MDKKTLDKIMAEIGVTSEGKAKLEELRQQPQPAKSRPMSFAIKRTSMDPTIPPHIRDYLGNYTEIEDSASGEPIAWGYPVIAKMGEQLWAETKQFGEMVFDHGQWYLITKVLTREEAVDKYGGIIHEEFGPKGGWKYVQFGQTLFKNKLMAPKKKS